jgi:hypothetical protein
MITAAFKAFLDQHRQRPRTVIVARADRELCDLLEGAGYKPGPHIDPDVPEGIVTYRRPE